MRADRNWRYYLVIVAIMALTFTSALAWARWISPANAGSSEVGPSALLCQHDPPPGVTAGNPATPSCGQDCKCKNGCKNGCGCKDCKCREEGCKNCNCKDCKCKENPKNCSCKDCKCPDCKCKAGEKCSCPHCQH